MKTRIVPASELDPEKGLRAEGYIGQVASKTEYAALEQQYCCKMLECKKLSEENKKLREERKVLIGAMSEVLRRANMAIEEADAIMCDVKENK